MYSTVGFEPETLEKKERLFVAEVARIVTVNRNYGLVITAAGRYVSSETYLTVYYIEYISRVTLQALGLWAGPAGCMAPPLPLHNGIPSVCPITLRDAFSVPMDEPCTSAIVLTTFAQI